MKQLLFKFSNNKKNKYFILFAASIIFLCIVSVASAVTFASQNPYWFFEHFDNVLLGSRQTSTNTAWQISAHAGNSTRLRNINLTEESLNNFSISSNSDEGNISILFSQNNIYKQIDISNFEDTIDLSDFVPGSIRIELVFQEAINFRVNIQW